MKRNLVAKILGMLLIATLVISSFPLGKISADPQENGDNTEEVYYGDVDDDGKIGAKDVTTLRRYLAGGWNVSINLDKADLDGDGNVGAKDVTLLRRYLAGGWGVTLLPKPVFEPRPIAVEQSSLSSIKMIFDMPVSAVNPENIIAYYMDGDEKIYLNIINTRVDSIYPIYVIVNFNSQIPQGETIYVEYCGKEVDSFNSVVVTENSISAIVVPDMVIIAGQETQIRYTLLDQNGVDITSAMGTVLNGIITTELKDAPIVSYITGLRVYCQTPNETFKVAVKYSWTDKNGVQHWIEGQGNIACIPEEPWRISGVMGAVTHESDQDFVSSDHRSFNYYGNKIAPLTINTDDAVLQIGVSYSRMGDMWIDTKDSIRGLNLASYPDQKTYTAYDLQSADESVVMIGSYTGNRTSLVLNNVGTTTIYVYGIMANGAKEIIGAIPIVVKPSPNPALNSLGEEYVYNNITDSEMRITASDAESLVAADGSVNMAIKDTECCIDTPDANVIQIAVPYTNINGTVYAGLEKAPLSTEFSEYVLESSDTNIMELGEIVSGKLKFTCKDIGKATLTLYGKDSNGTKTLLATKEVKVSRSKINSPEVKSFRQVSLDTLEVTFDRDVTNEKLWIGDFARYYTVQGTKIYDAESKEVTVTENIVLIKFTSNFIQGTEYSVEFNGSLAGGFTSVKVNSESVVTIVIDPQKILPDQFSRISYHLLDANGIDITGLLGGTLLGVVEFQIKEQERYPFAIIDGESIYLAEDNSACTVVGKYLWVDSTGTIKETESGEAVFYTGNGDLLPAVSEYGQGGSAPTRLEVYTYRGSVLPENMEKKLNAAYSEDSLNISVKVYDQYNQLLVGVPVNIEKLAIGNAGYSGENTIYSGDLLVLSAADVSGYGVLNLKLTCGSGEGECAKVLSLMIGNESSAARYVPVISNTKLDTSVTENSKQDSITVTLEGRTSGGFRLYGAAVTFTTTRPVAGSAAYGSYPRLVYTVYKDGRIMTPSDLPTFDGTTFYNVRESNGYAVKMPSGRYVLEFYKIDKNLNDKEVYSLLGATSFVVEDNQPKPVVKANANIERLSEMTHDAIAQAFDVTFDGTAVNSEDLRFDYTSNGAGDTAYVKGVSCTIRNQNGLGALNIYSVVDGLAKTAAGSDHPIATEYTGSLSDWKFDSVSSIVTDVNGSDYVAYGSVNTNCIGINPLSIDYSGTAVLQIAATYKNDGTTVTEAPGATGYSGYTGYYLRSSDEKVVMLGEQVAENKVRLILNKEGEANILVYGVRNDGYMEYLDDIPIKVVAARKVDSFNIIPNKNRINLAYASDAIDFYVMISDQYGNTMRGQSVKVERMVNGQGYALGTTDSEIYRLYAGDLASLGVAPGYTYIRFTCMSNNMQMMCNIQVGSEAFATNYKLLLSNTRMSINSIDPSRQQAVRVYSQGKANEFDLPGAPLYFSETVPTNDASSLREDIRSQLDTDGMVVIFTVKKDDVLQKRSDLPTFDGYAFYNCIQDANGDVVIMSPGQYTVTAFLIKSNNGSLEPVLEDTATFTVTE